MLQAFQGLGGASNVETTMHSFALRLYHLTTTDRAAERHGKYLLSPGAAAEYRSYYLGYNLASSLYDNSIANADVLAPNVLLIM
jgi:hypothetical protein